MIKKQVFVDSAKNRPNVEGLVLEFGAGDISLGVGIDMLDGFAFLTFENIDSPVEIGATAPHRRDFNGTPVVMKFDKVESVDVVIKFLEAVKKQLASST